ncbi:zinc-binding alcohol dehydrogenase [Pseudohyphozyma bogoriensis]|nr:zinc-binding alcohol dehydrogenase [Pseudohyphozyma bogoriensis]
MKTQALVLDAVKAPFVLKDINLEDPQDDEVLVKIVASGLCHTDIAIQLGQFPSAFPSIAGHEGSGTVVSVGKAVTRVAAGDSVLLSFAYCQSCHYCKAGHPSGCDEWIGRNFGRVRNAAVGAKACATDGEGKDVLGSFFGQSAFARHALVSESSVVKVPSSSDLVMLSPLGCGLQTGAGAVFNILKPSTSSSIVVFGLGAVGSAAVFAAAALGVKTIIVVDLVETRLKFAKEHGATHAFKGADVELLQKIKEVTDGLGAEYAVEATGATRVLRTAWEAVRNYGTVCSVGTPGPGIAPPFEIHENLLATKTYVGVTEGDSNPPEFIPKLIKLYEEGKFPVDKIAKTFKVEEFEDALHAICWMGTPGQEGKNQACEEMVAKAVSLGYRHFDTASGYGNEAAVGRALRSSSVPRSELFVTSKLHGTGHGCVAEAFQKTFDALGLEYLDLWLCHWPQAIDPVTKKFLGPEESPTMAETWKEMEKVQGRFSGKVKAIGVSNFSIKTLEALLLTAEIVPAVNQVETHPYLPVEELLQFCTEKGIHMTAYSPLGQYDSPILKDPAVLSIAEKYNKTPAQVLLSWAVQRGNMSVVPKSANPVRLAQNLETFPLTPDEFATLSNLHKTEGKFKSLCVYGGPGAGMSEKGKVNGWTYEELGWDERAWNFAMLAAPFSIPIYFFWRGWMVALGVAMYIVGFSSATIYRITTVNTNKIFGNFNAVQRGQDGMSRAPASA